MTVTLKTPVKGNYQNVMASFDKDLFEALKPPIGELEIVKFTGSSKGDIVHLRFLKPIKAEWISEITEDKITESRAWFVDVGTTLPWPLATWKHSHIVEKIDDENSMVVDEMTFTGKNALLTLLLYPAIYISFFPRKKIYKKYFSDKFIST